MCEDGVERTTSAKTYAEVWGTGGVAIGGATGALAVGADVVALVSLTGIAADLCALGTL